ncbi:MAG: hypothetical protein Q8916_12785 [Bacteroidota bacterium]|nr:hypothetical protein [Bacteroidota bacterium]MDP4231269.1 hypothetical protein [Bacteroidota bacterium]MDP4237173.1 hypothetical protein [Bacteroidota bacterium]
MTYTKKFKYITIIALLVLFVRENWTSLVPDEGVRITRLYVVPVIGVLLLILIYYYWRIEAAASKSFEQTDPDAALKKKTRISALSFFVIGGVSTYWYESYRTDNHYYITVFWSTLLFGALIFLAFRILREAN